MLNTKTRQKSERKTYVRRNGKWKEIPFKELTVGDNFQLFEPNGDQVCNHNNEHIFCATGSPYFCTDLEAWVVDIVE